MGRGSSVTEKGSATTASSTNEATTTPISGHNQSYDQTGTTGTSDHVYRQPRNAKGRYGIYNVFIPFGGIDVVSDSRHVGAGNQDGFLALSCAVNGTLTKPQN